MDEPIWREPYPDLRERLYWLYVRFLTSRGVPLKAWVRLSCPETGATVATEHTEAVEIDRDVETGTGIYHYDCPDCPETHRWLWGPPAPIRLTDADDDE